MSTRSYRVVFHQFAARHFIKDFEKKYKGAWLTTRKAITSQLHNIDMLLGSGRTNPPIHFSPDRRQYIIKHPFAVAGTRMSPKASGDRLIAQVDETQKLVTVLLVYHKSHVAKNQSETSWWEQAIKPLTNLT